MDKVEFIPNDKGAFVVQENGKRIGEMIVGVSGNYMSVYHTGVVDRMQGRGIGKRLATGMAEYARSHNLKVIIFCPFVKAIFKMAPEQYGDIWEQDADFIKLD